MRRAIAAFLALDAVTPDWEVGAQSTGKNSGESTGISYRF
jgi:hypothetical protein